MSRQGSLSLPVPLASISEQPAVRCGPSLSAVGAEEVLAETVDLRLAG